MIYLRINEEIVLQNKLIFRHDLIEEGLRLVERETVIGDTRKRCDIKYIDSLGRCLYVEVKEYIDEKAIEQIINYRDLISDSYARYMLISNNSILKPYEEILTEQKIEYRGINKNDISLELHTIPEIMKGNSKYTTKENVLIKLNKQRQIAEEICDYLSNLLHTIDNPILCNISDGIMYQLVEKNEKFLSLSTIGNRLLFHFPYGNRDEIYSKYKKTIPEIYCYKDNHPEEHDKEQNQIDIKMKDIKNLDYVKPLIDEAYTNSLSNR